MAFNPTNPDFKPTLNGYKKYGAFRFWCQQVLPLTFDDSLSYYELLNKLVDYLNKTMDNVNTLGGDVESLGTAYNELEDNVVENYNKIKNYLDTYFDNLDVQQQIDNKLDEMAADTSEHGLTALIAPFIPNLVSNWLQSNVTPTGSVVLLDKSLKIYDAAADAGITGGYVRGLKNAIYSDGEQLTNKFNIVAGGITNSGVNINTETYLLSRRRSSNFVECKFGDVISCSEAYDICLYFYSSNSVSSYLSNSGHLGSTVTVPYIENAGYIRIGIKRKDDENFENEEIPVVNYTNTINKISELKKEINNQQNILNATIEKQENLVTTNVGHYYANASGEIVEGNESRIGMDDYVDCKSSTNYCFSVFDSEITTSTYFYVSWLDDNKNFIQRDNIIKSADSLHNVFLSPSNAKFMNFSIYNTTNVAETTKLQITEGESIPAEYIYPYSAIDYVARAELEENVTDINEQIELVNTKTNDLEKELNNQQTVLNAITEKQENLVTTNVGHYYANASGVIVEGNTSRIGMDEYVECESSTNYCFSVFDSEITTTTDFYVSWLDENKNFIQRDNIRKSANSLHNVFLSPSNAKFMNFSIYNTTNVAETTKLQITEGESIPAEYISPYSAIDYVARAELGKVERYYPEYYDTNVENVIELTKENMGVIGNKGDSFVFITDPHWGINAKYSPFIIKKILNDTNIRQVICGGDALDSGSKANEIAKGYSFMQAFSYLTKGLKFVIGNHDGNKNNHVDDSSYWLTSEQIYAIFYPQAETELEDIHVTTGLHEQPTLYCYFDIPATKTRYLILGVPFGSIPDEEMTWITEQLDNNPSLNFVLFAHYLYSSASNSFTAAAQNLLNRCSSRANVRAIIFGHIHADLVKYTQSGVPVIATDTDAYDRLGSLNPNTATRGTITEHAFDVMSVNYNNNSVYCARVGRGKNRRVNGGVNIVDGTLTLTTNISSATWASNNVSVATVTDGVVTAISSGSAIISAEGNNDVEYWLVSVL